MISTKILWAICFFAADVVIAASLLLLLCTPHRRVPKAIEWMFPLRGKWLWRFLLAMSVLAYVALAPVGLMFLIRIIKNP